MGENLELDGRLATRSTMQWSDRPGGGFGPAGGEQSRRRPPDGPYGPEHVNVASQRADPDSLLNWVAGAVRTRRQIPELGAGRWRTLKTDDDTVLAHTCEMDGSGFVAVHSLSGEPRTVDVQVEDPDRLFEVLSTPGTGLRRADGHLTIDLPRYGHLWIQTDQPLQGHSKDLPRT